MGFYFGIFCASLLSLANARTTAATPTAYPEFDNCGFNLNATCDDKMKLFADGNLLAESDDWKSTSMVYIPPNSKEIEIRCIDGWILGGILASSDNGLITNNAWNCSSDNGLHWNNAHELGANGVTAEDISAHAKWIWTDRPTWTHTEQKRHTTAICTIKLPTNSVCGTTPTPTPTPTPICTDCVPCLFNGTTPTPTPTPSPTTTPPEPTQVSGFNLNATCNNKMELFVDGNLLATSDNWRDTSQVHIPANTQTIEIHCTDSCWLIEGILASTDNGLLTDDSWNCSSDNGITWSSAHEIVLNGLSVPDISPNAKWISTGRNTWMDGGKVICKVMLAIQSVSPVSTMSIPTELIPIHVDNQYSYYKVPMVAGSTINSSVIKQTCEQRGMTPQCYSISFSDSNCLMEPNDSGSAPSYELAGIICGANQRSPVKCPLLNNTFWYMHGWRSGAAWGVDEGKFDDGKNIKITSDNQYFAACLSPTGCPHNDKYIECPEFKDECDTGNFVDCMNRDCAKTCKCGIDGQWSAWSEYNSCSASCGNATKSRSRTCSNPPPSNGGKPCLGLEEEVVSCGFSECGLTLIHTDSNFKYYKVSVPESSKMTSATILSACERHGLKPQCAGTGKGWKYTDSNCIRVEDCENIDGCGTVLSNLLCSTSDPRKCATTLNMFWPMHEWRYGSACGVTEERYCGLKNDYISSSNKPYFAACIKPKGCANRLVTTTMTIEGRDVEVRCEDGEDKTEAWTVIQRRGQYNNTEDYFYKNFSEYENGFGSVDDELWIGLQNLATLSNDGDWELQVDLTDWDDKVYHAKYGKFSVGPAPTYQLHVEDFDDENSTLGDSLAYHNGSNFSTYDVDNDIDSSNCAERAVGAWWFKSCYLSNLNGENFASQHMESWRGIDWLHGKARGYSHYSWKASVMKIRKLNGKQRKITFRISSLSRRVQKASNIPNLTYKADGEAPNIPKLPKQTSHEASNLPKLREKETSSMVNVPEQTELKLEFQLKGKIGMEKVKISVDDTEEEFGLTTEWRLFSYARPSTGSFSVEFLNDIGYTDVFIRGHESQVTDLLPNFPANKFLGCGTKNEDEKCGSLRKGTLMWNGKYTYILKG